MKRLSVNKRSSLFKRQRWRKKFYNLGPWCNGPMLYNILQLYFMKSPNKPAFDPCRPFRPSPMSVGYPRSPPKIGASLAYPMNIRLGWKGFSGNKRSSLFSLVVSEKKFYNFGVSSQTFQLSDHRKFIESRNPYWKGRLSTFDLLVKIGCFVKKKNTVSVWKAATLN